MSSRNGEQTTSSYVNWCGHEQEIIPVPMRDGRVGFIPVLGEAR